MEGSRNLFTIRSLAYLNSENVKWKTFNLRVTRIYEKAFNDIKWTALYTAHVYTYISIYTYALNIKYSTRITSLWTQKVTYFSALRDSSAVQT